MAIKDSAIWEDTEKRCFAYLLDKIGGTEGQNAFRGSLPINAYNGWYFEMQGGGEPIDADINSTVPGGCGKWGMNAQVTGRFADRADGQKIGSLVRIHTPIADESMKGVQWFKPIGTPSLVKDAVEIGPDEFLDVWLLTYPLEVMMNPQVK